MMPLGVDSTPTWCGTGSYCSNPPMNHSVNIANQTSNFVSLFPAEMSNQANSDELSAFYEMEFQDDILQQEISGVPVNLDSFLNVLHAQSDTLPANTISTEIESSSLGQFGAEAKDALPDILETLNITRFLNSEQQYSLHIPELESETFHDITDFLKLDSSHSEGKLTVIETECSSQVKDTTENDSTLSSASVDNSSEKIISKASAKSQKTPHEKYLEMRRKNNIASRRSRQNRKVKNEEMASMIEQLEKQNSKLKSSLEELEKQKDNLQSYLFRLVKKSR